MKLTCKQAGVKARVAEDLVKLWCMVGAIPHEPMPNGEFLIEDAELDVFLEAGRKEAAQYERALRRRVVEDFPVGTGAAPQ